MKQLTKKQINEVCKLIEVAVSHLGDTDNERNSVHYSIGYYGRKITLLTELIKNGYDDCCGLTTFEDVLKCYTKSHE